MVQHHEQEDRIQAATKILDAADDLFARTGFDGTTTREIAERAGVNKALIHYHFDSKDGLLEKLLDRYYDKLASTLRPTLESSGPDLHDRFDDLIDRYLEFLVENRNFAKIVQREASGGRHVDQVQRRMVPLFAMAVAAIRQRYPASVGTDLDAVDVLTSFYGMVIATFTYSGVLGYLIDEDPLSAEMIEKRRRHLHAMFDLTIAALERLEAGEEL